MNYLARASAAHNYITTSLILLMLLFVFAMAGCDSPSDSLNEESKKSEANAQTTLQIQGYEITMMDLGTLGGEGDSYALAINDSGQIVEASYHPPSGKEVPVTWKNGEIVDLNIAPNSIFRSKSSATAINNNGAIIIDRGDDNFIWEDGKINRVFNIDYISAINDNRQLSGIRDGRAVIWENGNSERLTGSGIKALSATDITNSGIVVGGGKTCFCPESVPKAILWENGKIKKLGTLGEEGVYGSNANAVNNKRQVTGESRISADIFHAFIWEGGVMTDLGSLGNDDTIGNSINEKGQVVGIDFGVKDIYGETTRAVLWTDDHIIDLGSLEEGRSSAAYSINNKGQIVGKSAAGNGEDQDVLWEIKKIE